MNSSLVLSESLDEKAVQILVSVAIAELFPETSDKWRARNQGARAKFMEEFTERKETVRKEVIRGDDSLRRVLHEAVIEDVMGLFPYVLANGAWGLALLMRVLTTDHWSVIASLRLPARKAREPQMRATVLKVRRLFVCHSHISPSIRHSAALRS